MQWSSSPSPAKVRFSVRGTEVTEFSGLSLQELSGNKTGPKVGGRCFGTIESGGSGATGRAMGRRQMAGQGRGRNGDSLAISTSYHDRGRRQQCGDTRARWHAWGGGGGRAQPKMKRHLKGRHIDEEKMKTERGRVLIFDIIDKKNGWLTKKTVAYLSNSSYILAYAYWQQFSLWDAVPTNIYWIEN